MTPMLIGEVDMENSQKKFIKILSEKIAKSLNDGGFSYITEKINGNQMVYCFEECLELTEAIRELCEKGHYEETIIVSGDTLFF